uniref:uncharacterized protein LOC105350571 n=1 Tax=Fragaria vesca subsp. vesca TaxID=101020 RepID=UPI0005C8CC24|nr:PREDICTED: uncharacterized protein LOC105350571 [Fragaria vesca subsp. vesca]
MERTSSSVNSRWKVINQACGKWRESLDKAKTLHRSGENELDELMRAKSIFYDKEGKDFVFDHCWRVLKGTQKFGEMAPPTTPTSRIPTSINLGEEGISTNETETPPTRQALPQGQKAQKQAKKKGKQNNSEALHIQMQKANEQHEREYHQRQQLFEEARLIEQRADDARTMMVDPSTFNTPRKRGYWERKQQTIIDREQGTSNIPIHHQDQAPLEGDNDSLVGYVPVHETRWV